MRKTKEDAVTVGSDNPIQFLEEDTIGRAKSAREFAEQILQIDASKGLVVGVFGPWGSGKTSFVNLAKLCLEEKGIVVFDYNPWMFSGAAQLLDSFFAEISAQLKLRPGLVAVGRRLDDYAEIFTGMAWVPVVGPWVERARIAAKAIAKVFQQKKESSSGRRAKVENALSALGEPFVVVLDDIDRLTTAEIQDIFKLVRLTANFPNIIYLMAFDRNRVESALGEQGIPGRSYLEKILQIGIDLPVVPDKVLIHQITSGIDYALSRVENLSSFDQDRWVDVFYEIIKPLIITMRDVRRYVTTVCGTVRSSSGDIDLVDLLALEAVRVFMPDVHSMLQYSVSGLTTTYDFGTHMEPPHLKKQVEKLIEVAKDNSEVVNSLVRRLFPAGERFIGNTNYGSDWKSQWLRGRRVAHEHVLRLYLEKVAGADFKAFIDAEIAWSHMSSATEFDSCLRALDVDRLHDVINALVVFEEIFTLQDVVPGAVVLLNIMPDLPSRQRGMFDFDTKMVARRVVYRLLKLLKDQSAVESAVREILPQVVALSPKYELLLIVGYQEGAGHKLVSAESASRFEADWRAEVAEASPESLANEMALFQLLLHVQRTAGSTDLPVEIDSSPRTTLALLRSASGEALSNSGGRAVKRETHIAWDALVGLYGNEAVLKERVDVLKSSQPEGADPLVELAVKYAGGWRPKGVGEN